MPIYIFYHLFCINDSYRMFQETYNRIKKCGLLDKTTKIFVMLVGPERESYLTYVKDVDKVECHFGIGHRSEKDCLDLIYNLSKTCDFKALYIHSKGASLGKQRPGTEQFIEPVKSWKNYMEYFNIDLHDICLEQLEKYDTCGVELTTNPQLHYSGNFWWANSSYIRTLNKFDHTKLTHPDAERAYCEFWITDSPRINAANLYSHGLNLYNTIYSEESYKTTMTLEITPKPWTKTILNVPSAWKGLEQFLPSIIKTFHIKPKRMLEFGVDSGYSLDIFSQLFDEVTGVDLFQSDEHIGHEQGDDFYNNVVSTFSQHKNTNIIRQDFREYIKTDHSKYDLIHVDIVHFYKETYECAEWSLSHSDVVILHDTVSHPDMNRVCVDLSEKCGVGYYNIPHHHGLGILYKKNTIKPSYPMFSPLKSLIRP